MERTAQCILVWVALGAPLLADAQLFGSGEAQACYQEALSPANVTGTRTCTLAIRRGGLNVTDLAATYSNRGVIWARVGDVDKALADHNKSLELVPDSIGALINRANAYSRGQYYNEALADYDQAVKLSNKKFAPALFNRGWVYRRIGEPKEALKDFKIAARLMPDNERYQRVLAETERQIDEAKKAEKAARKKAREEARQRRRERAQSD